MIPVVIVIPNGIGLTFPSQVLGNDLDLQVSRSLAGALNRLRSVLVFIFAEGDV